MADERAGILQDNGLTRKQAERQVMEDAWREHGVKLVIIENAEVRKPLSGLVGRVFWPVNVSTVDLCDEDKLDALSIAAMRSRKKYEHNGQLPPELADQFEEAILQALAKKYGISLETVTR